VLAGRQLAHLAATRRPSHFARRSCDGTPGRVAHRHPAPKRWLDLGTGIGSVACSWLGGFRRRAGWVWRCKRSRPPCPSQSGLERRRRSRGSSQRAISRDSALLAGQGPFDLVAGTPPYFPIGTGPQSDGIPAGPLRFDITAGVRRTVKAEAASRAWHRRALGRRARRGASASASSPRGARMAWPLHYWRDVIPRPGARLRSSSSLAYDAGAQADVPGQGRRHWSCANDAKAGGTPEFAAVREVMGMPA